MELEEPEEQGPPAPELLVRAGLVFYGVMALVAVMWREGFDGVSLWVLPGAPAPELGRDILIGCGAGAAVVALSQLMTRLTSWGDELGRALAESLGPLSTPNAVLLASASGLAEEMLFRGALQPHVGLVAASLLFGLVHFVPRRELLPWTGFAVIVGFGLGWLFELTGNLVAPVLAHSVINGLNLPFLVQRYRSAPDGPPADPAA